jgi:hypothetical protein
VSISTPYGETGGFGEVSFDAQAVTLHADRAQLWAWAHQPGTHWPCTSLVLCPWLTVRYVHDGLCTIEHPDFSKEPGPSDRWLRHLPIDLAPVAQDELAAWAAELLRDTLPREHPAYPEAIGRFDARYPEGWPV